MQLQLVRPSYCISIDSGPTHWEDKGGLEPAEPYASYAPVNYDGQGPGESSCSTEHYSRQTLLNYQLN